MQAWDNLINPSKNINKAPEEIVQEIPTKDTYLQENSIAIDTFTAVRKNYSDYYKRLCAPMNLTREICDFLLNACCNHPIMSRVYADTVSTADTEIIFEIESNESEQIIGFLKETLHLLFPHSCHSAQDVSRFIIQQMVNPSLFACQMVPNKSMDDLQRIIIPPPHTLNFMRSENDWILYQDIDGHHVKIDMRNFIYQSLNPIRTENGVFATPLYKAAILPLVRHEEFMDAISYYVNKFGMNQVLVMPMNMYSRTSEFVSDIITKEEASARQTRMRDMANNMSNSAISFFPRYSPDDPLPSTMSFIEPPAQVESTNILLCSDILNACKSYLSLVGIMGAENQTTLSDTQKKMFMQTITSIQSKTAGVLTQLCKRKALLKGHRFKKFEIKLTKPSLDDAIRDMEAEKQSIEVADMKKQRENNPNGVVPTTQDNNALADNVPLIA